jgi:hypothetical protein
MGALEAFGWEWGSALLRWLHVTAAIAWIGGSFFFMHLDASLRRRAGDEPALAGVSWQVHGEGFYPMSKYLLAPASLPEYLIWHKWQSYWTWMSGFATSSPPSGVSTTGPARPMSSPATFSFPSTYARLTMRAGPPNSSISLLASTSSPPRAAFA